MLENGTLFAKRIRVLVTRPEQDAQRLVESLKKRGVEVLLEPLLTIEPQQGAKPKIMAEILRRPQAILLTSSNGVRALARFTDERNLPVITVGTISRQEAERLGFKQVSAGGGDVDALVKYVAEHCKPDAGFLLHVAGSVVAGDLSGALEEKGFDVHRVTAYRAEPVNHLSERTKAAIINTELDAIMFYSPRTAKVFDALMKAERLEYLARNITMVAISKNVLSALSWRQVQVAAEPSNDAMLKLIDMLRSDNVTSE